MPASSPSACGIIADLFLLMRHMPSYRGIHAASFFIVALLPLPHSCGIMLL
jgi:hypothetical protein